MKVQYFGDVNDYRKFALLRLPATVGGFKIGVCWMLTPNDSRKDGGKRANLELPGKWQEYDSSLFIELNEVLKEPDPDDLPRIERKGLLPNATFFNDLTPEERGARANFHKACLAAFDGRDIVFFDPGQRPQCSVSSEGMEEFRQVRLQ
jgi:hypothetical protein